MSSPIHAALQLSVASPRGVIVAILEADYRALVSVCSEYPKCRYNRGWVNSYISTFVIVVAAFVVLIYDYRESSSSNSQLRLDSHILKVLTFDREVWNRASVKRSCADVSRSRISACVAHA